MNDVAFYEEQHLKRECFILTQKSNTPKIKRNLLSIDYNMSKMTNLTNKLMANERTGHSTHIIVLPVMCE